MTLLIPLSAVMAQGDTLGVKRNLQSIENNIPLVIVKDSILPEKKGNESTNLTENSSNFKPNPTKAILYSAIFPGLGQIYNRKYWKLPILYGGFLGCFYAISWNNTLYNDYKHAYSDIFENGKEAESLKNFLPYGTKPENLTDGDIQWFTTTFKSRKDFYRRNKELSIIITVGVYALSILDAYVDAQLFDFDISPDLSLRVEPVIYNKSEFNARSLGLQCSIKF
ncbi:MAG: DUF5683 domain-containing protein [Candidatus Azobacteroides sp.]|nr:DUF5683 domain-containing protein [Candidatus Azobacteroides sp.]